LIHDESMTQILSDALGQSDLLFLRETMPETYIYPKLRSGFPNWFLELIEKGDFDDWVMKATEVETDFCWASRSVIIGRSYKNVGTERLRQAFAKGESIDPEKNVGQSPILQRFHISQEFSDTWNALVERSKPSEYLKLLGETLDETVVNFPATNPVSVRLAIHFFVSNTKQKTFCPDYGYLTLRQSHLAHGDRDSIEGAFKIV
jgi:hypothetical protein